MTQPPHFPLPEALASVRSLLGRHGGDWAVFGAIAANVYRRDPRTTGDLDLLATLSRDGMRSTAGDAEAEGWSVRFLHPDGSMLRITHPDHGAVDVIAVEMEYQQGALRRSRTETLPNGLSVRVLAVEDVIIHKLIADRHQDAADVQSILQAKPLIDQEYLDHWLNEWEVRDRYEAIASEVAEAEAQARMKPGRETRPSGSISGSARDA